MEDMNLLKLTMGICLIVASVLMFSIWRERLGSLKGDDRLHFLMYKISGGVWLLAIFALCGGFYFLLDPMLS